MKNRRNLILFISIFVLISFLSACNIGTKNNKTGANDTTFLINSVYSEKSAEKMTDSDLINLLQNELYLNNRIIQEWICTGGTLKREPGTTYASGDNRADYQLITNIKDKNSLENYIKSVFTAEYSEGTIYPMLFEGALPLFIEAEGKLYNNVNTGGALAYYPDFSRAKVISKNADGFDVEVPITYIDDPDGKLYTYKVVLRDGKWLLDNDYWFDL